MHRKDPAKQQFQQISKLLRTTLTQKKQLLQEHLQQEPTTSKKFNAEHVEQLLRRDLAQALTPFKPAVHGREGPRSLDKQAQLINHKERILYNTLSRSKDAKKPLVLLEDSEGVSSRGFQIKMLKKGFVPDFVRASTKLKHVSSQRIVNKIEETYSAKINLTNRINQQYMTIRSSSLYPELVELKVVEGYKTMRSRESGPGNSFADLLAILQQRHRKQQSLEKVHQKIKFIKKSSIQPYNQPEHLRSKAKLRRYSVGSLRAAAKQQQSNK